MCGSVFFDNLLPFRLGAVVNSPPTGACVVGRGTAVGKSFLSSGSGVLGNGPRVTGFDLADHSGQHLLLRRQNVVAAGGRFGCHGIYRPSIHSHVSHYGSGVSGGAAGVRVHRVEVQADAEVASGCLFSREYDAGTHVDGADSNSL